MMYVDVEKCTGCGVCVENCPVDAIALQAGKAAINTDTCLVCGSCAQACQVGAISEVSLPVPVQPLLIRPLERQASVPASSSPVGGRLAWAAPLWSFLGREIFPRLADSLVTAVDRRLSAMPEPDAISSPGMGSQNSRRGRQGRRRRRGRRFS